MGQPNYVNGFKPTLHVHMLFVPLHWRKPRMIFVDSMSDLFHKDVPDAFIFRVFEVMRTASWHTFQVLTKRADRLLHLSGQINWPPNVWVGVSVEDNRYRWRIQCLRLTNAAIKFLSLEPLLAPMCSLDLDGIDWVIVGGESGPGARPMRAEWVRDLRDQCHEEGIPFFFKQWSGVFPKRQGRELDGRIYDQFPSLPRTNHRGQTPTSQVVKELTDNSIADQSW
jgi:protein gp37